MTIKEKKELQKKQLEILDEIKRLCEKHKIKYWLDSGSCLGAVRHKGFIPWDDDIDLGMLRKDYDKFIKICKKELDNKFYLQTTETDNNFALEFTKIRMNNTLLREKLNEGKNIHQGIFIDIFPYDNTSNNKFIRNYLQYKTAILRILVLRKLGYTVKPKSLFQKIFINILTFLSQFINIKNIRKKLNKIYYKYKTGEYVAVFVGTNIKGNVHKASIFKETINVPFEDRMYPIPKKYDEYLTNGYGDYMTPPPKAIREIGHGITEIKFKTKEKFGIDINK